MPPQTLSELTLKPLPPPSPHWLVLDLDSGWPGSVIGHSATLGGRVSAAAEPLRNAAGRAVFIGTDGCSHYCGAVGRGYWNGCPGLCDGQCGPLSGCNCPDCQ